MLKKLGKTEIVISVLALFTVIAIAFTEQLTITGSATARAAVWKIRFGSLGGEPILTGSAKEITAPVIDENGTSIKTFSFEFDGINDSIAYSFWVANEGDLDAKIQSIEFSKPTCTESDGLNKRGGGMDATLTCGNLNYNLQYENSAASRPEENRVEVGDDLKAHESRKMVFTFSYDARNASEPYDDVRVSGVDLTITYVQA